MSSINKLIGEVSKNGVARTNQFSVQFNSLPDGVTLPSNSDSFSVSCEIASFPGRGYATSERRTYGPLIKLPYEKLFNEISMTFRCSKKFEERKFFDSWLNVVAGDNHHFSYFGDYARDIAIKQISSQSSGPDYSLTLIDAYPIAIGDLTGDQSTKDDYFKLEVTFAYRSLQEGSETRGLDDTSSINANFA